MLVIMLPGASVKTHSSSVSAGIMAQCQVLVLAGTNNSPFVTEFRSNSFNLGQSLNQPAYCFQALAITSGPRLNYSLNLGNVSNQSTDGTNVPMYSAGVSENFRLVSSSLSIVNATAPINQQGTVTTYDSCRAPTTSDGTSSVPCYIGVN